MDGAKLDAEDFFKRWKQIGGAPREAQKVFGLNAKGRSINSSFTRRVVDGFKWGVLDGVDPNAKNMVGATVLHTTTGGKFGCLMRLEPNYESKVSFRAHVFFSDLLLTTRSDVPSHNQGNGRVSSANIIEIDGGSTVAGGSREVNCTEKVNFLFGLLRRWP
jgi:hypothetical protein